MSVSGIVSNFCRATSMGVLDCDNPLQSITPICIAAIAVSAIALARADFIYDGCRRLYVTLGRKDDVFAVRRNLQNPSWARSSEAEQCLERAIQEGKMGVYRLLRSEQVAVSDKCLILALKNRRVNMIPNLLRECDLAAVDDECNTPLMLAIQKGLLDEARQILNNLNPEVVNRQNKQGYTALHMAAREHANFVGELIKAEADPAITCKDGRTPLHLAADHDNAESVGALVENGAYVNAQDGEGNTPLHNTVNSLGARLKAAKALLKSSSINPNIYNTEGVMPLHDACAMLDGKDDMALLLLRKYFKI